MNPPRQVTRQGKYQRKYRRKEDERGVRAVSYIERILALLPSTKSSDDNLIPSSPENSAAPTTQFQGQQYFTCRSELKTTIKIKLIVISFYSPVCFFAHFCHVMTNEMSFISFTKILKDLKTIFAILHPTLSVH